MSKTGKDKKKSSKGEKLQETTPKIVDKKVDLTKNVKDVLASENTLVVMELATLNELVTLINSADSFKGITFGEAYAVVQAITNGKTKKLNNWIEENIVK